MVAELEHKKIGGHRIGVARPTLHGKTVHFIPKGGTPWETKGEKRIKTKVESRKPANRQKRSRENSRGALLGGTCGLHLCEAHNS